jgi:hypothetical protein
VTEIGSYAFSYCSGFTGSLTILEGVSSIGSYAFSGCSGLTGSLTIPEGVTEIGSYAFSGCSGFTGSLTIPEGVTEIGIYAFQNCSGLTGSLTIPEGVTEIGSFAFYFCSGLTGSLTIPEGVTSIGSGAFFDCSGLKEVTIGNSVTYIGNSAFHYCSGLTDIINYATVPQTINADELFYQANRSRITLWVPAGTEASYLAAGWTGFKDIKAVEQKPTSIEMLPEANPLQAWMRNGLLHIEGLNEGGVWSVYSVSGALIYRSIATGDEADIALPTAGVYIIQSEERTVKVVLN